MSQHKNPVRRALSEAASVVREAGRAVRKSFSAEYVHTTVQQIIDDLDERYPQGGRGAHKLRIARILMGRVFGDEYVNREWTFLSDLVGALVALKKA